MASMEVVLRQPLETLEPDELLQSCKAHRKFLNEVRGEVNQLRAERNNHQRVCSFPDSLSSEIRLNWTRANIDSPDDTTSSFFCFGEHPKFPTIIAFKPDHYLKAENRLVFQKEAEESKVIFSTLPSRRSNTIYVFVESSATGASSLAKRYRLSTNATPPDGFVTHWTIRLKKLKLSARIKIWSGRIKWVYIVVPEKSVKTVC